MQSYKGKEYVTICVILISALLFLFVICTSRVFSQSGFSLEDYKQFLNIHQNMTSDQLLQMHDAGLFKADLKMNTDSVVYLDSICIKYNLTDYEKQLLNKQLEQKD